MTRTKAHQKIRLIRKMPITVPNNMARETMAVTLEYRRLADDAQICKNPLTGIYNTTLQVL